MYGCITSSNYSMKADLYRESVASDDTGQIIRTWEKESEIDCLCTPSKQKYGEQWSEKYDYTVLVDMQTMGDIMGTDRIVNIRDGFGAVPWKEDAGTPTVFSVVSIIPNINMITGFNDYTVTLARSEVQEDY